MKLKFRYISFSLILPLICCIGSKNPIYAQDQSADYHVYTLGNFADIDVNSTALNVLSQKISEERVPSAILFTGDITKANLTDPIDL